MKPFSNDNYAAERNPVYRALWEPDASDLAELFQAGKDPVPAEVQRVMNRSCELVLTHREHNTLRGSDGKHSEQVLQGLGKAGYWGLLVERDYGGSGCAMQHFLTFLTRMAVIDSPLAGLAAVHGCIGAVDPLQTFGTSEQKRQFLPALASGERLSAFASTEPGAGSDLRAIQTTVVQTATGWNISGRKAFITNLAAGRTIGLLCKVDEQLAVIVSTLPDRETEHFELIPNPLHPLKHTLNSGMLLRNLPVAADSLITPPPGKDGRTIVFHGLNRGRAGICALAAGHLRVLLAGMISWAKQRTAHGKKLAEMELIQARCARVAALVAGCDALAKWCGSLLDAGFRGEVECIIAKVFASEAVKHAAFDLALPTHGGRFFLQGHAAGDMAYDYLAPCIYEGENDLLRLAMIQSLAKIFTVTDSTTSAAADNPVWLVKAWKDVQRRIIENLLAARKLHATTQSELVEFARAIQALVTYCVTNTARERCEDVLLTGAADLLCRQLQNQIQGRAPRGADFRAELELGQQLLAGDLSLVKDVLPLKDPLVGEVSSPFSPSPQPSPRSTEERE